MSAWWKQGSSITFVERQVGWQIEGTGSERAVVAIATIGNVRLMFRVKSITAQWKRAPRLKVVVQARTRTVAEIFGDWFWSR